MASVFVGIPTMNRPDFVTHTIQSVIDQTYQDIEIVVSDNCSDPGVADSIQTFINNLSDSRVRFHQQKENVGEYGQGRYFLKEARDSQYFIILHDDDVLCRNYIEKAVDALLASSDCDLFLADPYIFNEHGEKDETLRQKYLKEHGRNGARTGTFPIVDSHLEGGFTCISGTLFRTRALIESGFVDPDGVGNYPFETDIFLHLGDIRAKGWYQKEELLGFCFHTGSMRHYIKMLENEKTVDAMIHIFVSRRYSGYAEQRRRVILSRLYRAKSFIAARQGRFAVARKNIKKAYKYNKLSVKLWLTAPFMLLVPRLFYWLLPELPLTREAPLLKR
jgi:glycosyltransferase involved in cell wall biosynthesis